MPSLPPHPQLPPRPTGLPGHNVSKPGQVPTSTHSAGAGKIRLWVYAVGVAAIVGSGTWIGATWKTDRQREAAKKSQQVLLQPSVVAPTSTRSDSLADTAYIKSLDMLESRRSQLVAQKVGLETKLRDFRDTRRRKEEEERQRREFGLKR